jgi:hypothetical protein
MSIEQKQVNLEFLRNEYVAFMGKVAKLPGSPIQKQQAFLRFDEGHMWIQNAIVTHQEKAPVPDELQNDLNQAAAEHDKENETTASNPVDVPVTSV